MEDMHYRSRDSILLWFDVCLELSVAWVDVGIVACWGYLVIGALCASSSGTLLVS